MTLNTNYTIMYLVGENDSLIANHNRNDTDEYNDQLQGKTEAIQHSTYILPVTMVTIHHFTHGNGHMEQRGQGH